MVCGYDVEVIGRFEEGLRCQLCKKILKDAVQTSTGNRACEACYNEAKRFTAQCPIDKESPKICFKDKHVRKQVDQLKVYCTNKCRGCNWIGLLMNLEGHVQKDCNHKPDGQCPWSCGEAVTEETLKDHLLTCVNISSPKCCPFMALGCDYNGQPALSEHLHLHNVKHAQMLLPRVILNSLHCDQPHANIGEQENWKLERVKFTQEVHLLNAKVEKLEKETAQADLKFNVLFKEIESLKKDRAEDENRMLSVMNDSVDSANEENHDKISLLQGSCDSMHTALAKIDMRQLLLENTSYDGQMIWKIDNYRKKMSQAESGEMKALHSAPCHTSRYGYKFCARLYLNGDGMGQGTHLSLFFVLMRSPYDSFLQWPFLQRVTFKLLNPSKTDAPHQEFFIPQANGASFKQPENDMNLATGCPLFISKERLVDFIENDCIYIQLIVHPA